MRNINEDQLALAREPADMDTVELDTSEDFPGNEAVAGEPRTRQLKGTRLTIFFSFFSITHKRLKRTLFNQTKQDKMRKISRGFSSSKPQTR